MPARKAPPASRALAAKMAAGRGRVSEPPPAPGPLLPRKMTLDLDTTRFEVLREQAYRLRVPGSALLRALIDVLLIEGGAPKLLARAAELAARETEILRVRRPDVLRNRKP